VRAAYCPNATRAWAAVDTAFSIEADCLQRQEVIVVAGCCSSKWRVLGALREKVIRLREAGRGVAMRPMSRRESAMVVLEVKRCLQ
jgi:hypothetical protein